MGGIRILTFEKKIIMINEKGLVPPQKKKRTWLPACRNRNL